MNTGYFDMHNVEIKVGDILFNKSVNYCYDSPVICEGNNFVVKLNDCDLTVYLSDLNLSDIEIRN